MNKIFSRIRFFSFISLRFLLTGKNKHLSSATGFITLLIITISVLLSTVLIGMINGFHDGIVEKHIDKSFHVSIEKKYIYNVDEKLVNLSNINVVKHVIPFSDVKAVIKKEERFSPIFLRGLTDVILSDNLNFRQNFRLIAGNYDFQSNYHVALGKGLARKLNICVKDIEENKTVFVKIISLFKRQKQKKQTSFSQNYIYKTFIVSGIFTSGYREYDDYMAFTTLETANVMLNVSNCVSGIGIILTDKGYSTALTDFIKGEYYNLRHYIKTWRHGSSKLSSTFTLQKRILYMMVIIVLLINFVMIYINVRLFVVDRFRDVIILTTLGTKEKDITLIYLYSSFLLTTLGIVIGLLLGLFVNINFNDLIVVLQSAINIYMDIIRHSPLLNWLFDFNNIDNYELLSGSWLSSGFYSYSISFKELLMLVIIYLTAGMTSSYLAIRNLRVTNIAHSLRCSR